MARTGPQCQLVRRDESRTILTDGGFEGIDNWMKLQRVLDMRPAVRCFCDFFLGILVQHEQLISKSIDTVLDRSCSELANVVLGKKFAQVSVLQK